MNGRLNVCCLRRLVVFSAAAALALGAAIYQPRSIFAQSPKNTAEELLGLSAVKGGLVVLVGCHEPETAIAIGKSGQYLVQVLVLSNDQLMQVRKAIYREGLYGKVSADVLRGKHLPYIDNIVNLAVVYDAKLIAPDEVRRVLCPGGVALVRHDNGWVKAEKAWPSEIDEWTHYLHDSTNNAVSKDKIVGPPRRLQWVAAPRYGRHHDRMSSVNAVVTAGGRIFYVADEAPRFSILLQPQWKLIARDAFNGALLWKRDITKWHPHLWPLKSGPAQLPRRLVATDKLVFVTLSIDGPVVALDAETGRTIREYAETKPAEELVYRDGVLYVQVNPGLKVSELFNMQRVSRAYRDRFWEETPRRIMALDAATGKVLWQVERPVLPCTLAVDDTRVVFHDGQRVVCLSRDDGQLLWESEPVARAETIASFYAPTLVLYQDVVLFAGGETAGLQTGSWYTGGKDTLTALSAKTGKILWQAYHPPSGYRSPEDVLVAGGLVWCGETTSGRADGLFIGRDPFTGKIVSQFTPDVQTYWFHHRCYRGKATERYLLMSRTGIEFIDFANKHWIPHHWVRGACLYGVMPANGLIYAPSHPCACYLESKLDGFNALAPASNGPRIPQELAATERLEKGPVYGLPVDLPEEQDNWPTYRGDNARSGKAKCDLPDKPTVNWKAKLSGRITSPTIAGMKVFVAEIDAHTLHALDASTGTEVWSFTAGGRIDSPPTIWKGRVLFGCRDGYVYCLRADDGQLIWRFRAAPIDQRLVAYDQLESVWPVHGSVLVREGVVYCAAGRSMFLDNGIRMLLIDAVTGQLIKESVYDETDRESGKKLVEFVSWLNMPPAQPDVPSCDDRYVYMRSQAFDFQGNRLPLKPIPRGADADRGAPPPVQDPQLAHLFSPTGLLDDSWWHRTYWVYGSNFVSGWCGYYLAGKAAPSGRILCFDDRHVYGFGRRPEFYRWTTPIEHQLFCAAKQFPQPEELTGGGRRIDFVSVAKSKSLNPAGKPITVEAWIRADKPTGVILARGGANQGFVLWVKNGKIAAGVRIDSELTELVGKSTITGRWAHVAMVLADGKLQLFVDGKLEGETNCNTLQKDPAEALQIGADDGSLVGSYQGPTPFNGLIDEVALYTKKLDRAVLAKLADKTASVDRVQFGPALYFDFENGKAIDKSGNNNNGELSGPRSAKGMFKTALRFRGVDRAGFWVTHEWTQQVPMLVRAMVLSDNKLVICGPPDLVDEVDAFRRYNDPEVQKLLAKQHDAWLGLYGSLLWIVSAESGLATCQTKLPTIPVFDGLAAAYGRLYMSCADGSVICLGP